MALQGLPRLVQGVSKAFPRPSKALQGLPMGFQSLPRSSMACPRLSQTFRGHPKPFEAFESAASRSPSKAFQNVPSAKAFRGLL